MSSNAAINETSNVTFLPTTSKAQTAKEVIAANIKLLIEQLEAGHSERLTAYLTAMSRFHNYSFGNFLEIARQRPDSIRVAGDRLIQWVGEIMQVATQEATRDLSTITIHWIYD